MRGHPGYASPPGPRPSYSREHDVLLRAREWLEQHCPGRYEAIFSNRFYLRSPTGAAPRGMVARCWRCSIFPENLLRGDNQNDIPMMAHPPSRLPRQLCSGGEGLGRDHPIATAMTASSATLWAAGTDLSGLNRRKQVATARQKGRMSFLPGCFQSANFNRNLRGISTGKLKLQGVLCSGTNGKRGGAMSGADLLNMMSGLIGSPPTGRRTPPAGPGGGAARGGVRERSGGRRCWCVRPAALLGAGKLWDGAPPPRSPGEAGPRRPSSRGRSCWSSFSRWPGRSQAAEALLARPEDYPEELLELAVRNPEALDFVVRYPPEKDAQPTRLCGRSGRGDLPPADAVGPRWGCAPYGDGPDGPERLRPHRPGYGGMRTDRGWVRSPPGQWPSTRTRRDTMWRARAPKWELMSTGCQHFGLVAGSFLWTAPSWCGSWRTDSPSCAAWAPAISTPPRATSFDHRGGGTGSSTSTTPTAAPTVRSCGTMTPWPPRSATSGPIRWLDKEKRRRASVRMGLGAAAFCGGSALPLQEVAGLHVGGGQGEGQGYFCRACPVRGPPTQRSPCASGWPWPPPG